MNTRACRSVRRSLHATFVVLFLAAVSLGLTACGRSHHPSPPPAIDSEEFLVHKVRYPGESYSVIAAWYTGQPARWKEIAAANPTVPPNRISLGKKILIPRTLLKRSSPLTEEYARKFLPKPAELVPVVEAPQRPLTEMSTPVVPASVRPPAEAPPAVRGRERRREQIQSTVPVRSPALTDEERIRHRDELLRELQG